MSESIPADIMKIAEECAEALIVRMCVTMDHSFGLQSEQEQRGLRLSMSQIAYHDVRPAIAKAILEERRRHQDQDTSSEFERLLSK